MTKAWNIAVAVTALAGLSAGLPAAAAQFEDLFDDIDDELDLGDFDDTPDFLDDFDIDDIVDDDCVDERTGTVEDDSVASIADVDTAFDIDNSRDQIVDINEADILLGIALDNNGFDDVEFDILRDVDATRGFRVGADQNVDLERDDVFNAVALGFDARGGGRDAIDCVADVSTDFEATDTIRHRIDLDEDDTLLGIATENSLGGSRTSLLDLADLSLNRASTRGFHRSIDLDRDDVFLSLVLGAGG